MVSNIPVIPVAVPNKYGLGVKRVLTHGNPIYGFKMTINGILECVEALCRNYVIRQIIPGRILGPLFEMWDVLCKNMPNLKNAICYGTGGHPWLNFSFWCNSSNESVLFWSYSCLVRSFGPGSFGPDSQSESFHPNFNGGSFWLDFRGESFWPDIFFMCVWWGWGGEKIG